MQIHWRFAKNMVANLGRGGAAALVALLLPPILIRHMTPSSYAVWVLVLQTAAYVSYLNFGLQTAIGRYVAFANEKNDLELRDSVFSTAFAGLCVAAVVSLVCLAVVVLAAPAIFPSVPSGLIPQMRWALLIVAISLAVELPASASNGVFVGLERYELPAMTIGGARVVSSLGIIVASLAGKSLVLMAAIIATTNLISYLAQYLILRRVAPDIRFRASMVRRSTARELYGYCFGLTIMNFSMLLVNGVDLMLVGRFDFAAVTPYSVSASMIAVLLGLLYAVVNVILPHASALHAREKAVEMGKLLISSTRICMLLILLTGLPILLYAGPILGLWIGSMYIHVGKPLLVVLIVANIIRMIALPYSIVLIAAGKQNYIKISPLAEGISNFAISIVLGLLLGSIGVALGTFCGALVGIAAVLFYAMPRTKSAIHVSRRDFVMSGVLLPILWTSPLLVSGVISLSGIPIQPAVFALVYSLSLVGAGTLLYRTQGGLKGLRPASELVG